MVYPLDWCFNAQEHYVENWLSVDYNPKCVIYQFYVMIWEKQIYESHFLICPHIFRETGNDNMDFDDSISSG
jgi:hypothetical protein